MDSLSGEMQGKLGANTPLPRRETLLLCFTPPVVPEQIEHYQRNSDTDEKDTDYRKNIKPVRESTNVPCWCASLQGVAQYCRMLKQRGRTAVDSYQSSTYFFHLASYMTNLHKLSVEKCGDTHHRQISAEILPPVTLAWLHDWGSN